MMLEISISPEAEAKLREKAAAVGEDVAAYASGVLERNARLPLTLEEISGPLAEEFRQSGMTEDELTKLLDDAKNETRRMRQTRDNAGYNESNSGNFPDVD